MSLSKRINEKDVSVVTDIKAKILENLSKDEEYTKLYEVDAKSEAKKLEKLTGIKPETVRSKDELMFVFPDGSSAILRTDKDSVIFEYYTDKMEFINTYTRAKGLYSYLTQSGVLNEAGIKIKVSFDKGIKHSDLSKEQIAFLTSITKDNFDDKMKSDNNVELFGKQGYEIFADFDKKEIEIVKK